VILIRDIVTGGANLGFEFQIVLWLWFTVLFANFAEAVAEGRGKAQADALRRTRTETQAKLLIGDRRNSGGWRARASRSAMWSWSRPATPFHRTARWWKASPR
jgi:High-affinity K+ transport system, ATPase chain B